jgi:hypothetical protein
LFFVNNAGSRFLPEGVKFVPECTESNYRKIIFFHCKSYYLAGICAEGSVVFSASQDTDCGMVA